MSQKKIYPWVLVGLLCGVALLNYMDRQMLSTMRPAMEGDIRELQSAANFGYLMAIFLWVYGLMSPVSGIIADKLNRKWLIVGSLFVWSGVTFSMGYATSFYQLYWLRAVMGISEALYIPAGLSLIAEYHPGKTRSLAIGIHMTGLYFGQAIGGFGAKIAASFSWHSAFYYFGIAGVLYSFVLILFLREIRVSGRADPDPAISVKRNLSLYQRLALLFKSRYFWTILMFFAVSSLPGWAVKNWLPTLFAQNLNLPMSSAGPLSTITIAASSFLGVLFGGILSDRWVQRNIRARIFTVTIGIGLTIPSLILLGFGHSLVSAITAAICFGFGFGMFDANSMPVLCQFVSAKYRATAYGILNMTGVFSGAIITSILGKSSDSGDLGKGFAMMAAIVLIALLVQLYFLHPRVDDFVDD